MRLAASSHGGFPRRDESVRVLLALLLRAPVENRADGNAVSRQFSILVASSNRRGYSCPFDHLPDGECPARTRDRLLTCPKPDASDWLLPLVRRFSFARI